MTLRIYNDVMADFVLNFVVVDIDDIESINVKDPTKKYRKVATFDTEELAKEYVAMKSNETTNDIDYKKVPKADLVNMYKHLLYEHEGMKQKIQNILTPGYTWDKCPESMGR